MSSGFVESKQLCASPRTIVVGIGSTPRVEGVGVMQCCGGHEGTPEASRTLQHFYPGCAKMAILAW